MSEAAKPVSIKVELEMVEIARINELKAKGISQEAAHFELLLNRTDMLGAHVQMLEGRMAELEKRLGVPKLVLPSDLN